MFSTSALAHTCPSVATAIGAGLDVTAMYPNGQPVGTNSVAPGDELLFQLTLIYTRFALDEQVHAAFQNGRLLVHIGGGTGDATPPGGIPLIGGDGGEGCSGTNNFKSLLMPYSVSTADAILGYIPVVGIYTNGDAHIGQNHANSAVHASRTSQVAVRGVVIPPCTMSCLIAPATNRVCQGRPATFAVTATNGSAPYRIVWSGPSDFVSTNTSITISNAQPNNAGLYSATVTDSNNCTTMCEARLIVDPLPACFVSPGATSICAGGSATFTANVSSESGVTFSWSGPGEFFSTNQSITVSSAGNYTVTVIDANGCSSSCTATLTVNQIPAISVSPATNEVCAGTSATFAIAPLSGSPPFSFSWTGPAGFSSTNQTITILNVQSNFAGEFRVTIVDVNGCASSNQFGRLIVNGSPVAQIVPATNEVCAGQSATFTVSPSGGMAPYRFSWGGPNGFASTNQTITISSASFTNAGLYLVTVTDARGCTNSSARGRLLVNPNPICMVSPSNLQVCAGTAASFSIIPSLGTAPYRFNWTGPLGFSSTNQNITLSAVGDVNSGDYRAVIVDAEGCVSPAVFARLTVMRNPVCAIVPSVTNICMDSCIDLRVSATSGAAPYTIVLLNEAIPVSTNITSTNAVFTLCPTTIGTNVYTAQVKDNNGCVTACTGNVVVMPRPSSVVSPINTNVCFGECIQLAVTPANGLAPYTVTLFHGLNAIGTNVASSTAAFNVCPPLGTNSYTLTITDANGCLGTGASHIVVNPNPICAVVPATNDICLGGSALFTANASLGTPPYQFTWSGPGGFLSTNQTINISNAQPSQSGTYRSTVTDANGCISSCAAELLVDNPLCTMTPSVPAVCVNSCLDLTVRPFGGFAPYRVIVTGPGGFAVTNVTTSNVTVRVCPPALGPNVYVAVVTDAKGCTTTCQTSITANAPVVGPAIVCPQAVNTYSIARSGDNPVYEWRLLQNNSAARIVASSGPSVQVYSGTNGSYLLHLDVRSGESIVESCDHLSTIVDTLPPVITCGNSLIVNENPRSGGFAVVNFPAPTVTDNCDTNPVVACVPPSGSTFAVGQTTVNCTATDDLGNTATCSFNIKVVPFVIIVVTSSGDSGPGTLRQALNDANATPGLNIIRFQLPGAPPQTIRPLTPLPPVTEPVRIEATAAGTSNAPVVVLDGSLTRIPSFAPPGTGGSAAATYGLLLLSRSNLVRGLIINRFDTGIRVGGEGGNRIEANWIGTDATGLVAAPNTGSGIVIQSSDNVVAANVISGNGGDGVELDGAVARNNQIVGNRIGIGADSSLPLGNGGAGVRLMNGANGNTVGGPLRPLGNLIGFNSNSGVVLEGSAGTGNRISANSIGANNGLGIDLGDSGSTANDPLDADAGPNGYQNFPMISAARTDTTESTVIAGTFSSVPSRMFQIEFFLQPSGLVSSFEQGQTFLGATSAATDASGNATFEAEFLTPGSKGQSVVATATAADGSTSEFSPAFPVQTPPETALGPSSTTVPNGGSVTLCVEVTGIGPFTYQWRREGRNIPGETNRCITITNFDLRVAGTYMVAVGNDAGAVLSESSLLLISDGPRLQGGDMFAARLSVIGSNGVALGSNIGATGEAGEPEHFNRPPTRSIWYTWTPPGTGIATFRTTGSTFDTLLAVYVGSSLGDLLEVAADDDRGGFLSSEVHFNAREGTNYHIVVDGFGAADGDSVLSWEFEATPRLLPVILQHPRSVTVAPGGLVMFTVDAVSGCNDGHHDCRHYHDHSPGHTNEPIILDYQWFFNGTAIPGATNTNYVVFSVSDEFVGEYTVQVSKFGRTVESRPASLQINVTGEEVQNAFAADKVLAALETPILLGGFITPPPGPPPETPGHAPAQAFSAAATVVRGYTGTQVFNTGNGGTEANDQPICGVIGGASVWVTFVPQDTGLLHLNTDGSSYNTVMGIFVRSAINPAILQLIDCDNNSGLDGRDSALNLPVVSGATNFVMVDGVNAATGTLKLNYSLVTSSTMISLGTTAQGHVQVRVVGHPAMRFRLEESVDFTNWEPLITTNSASGIFDFIDTGSQLQSTRAYRAVMLP